MFNDQAHGARTSATLYSIIETVKANGMEPLHYLIFILRCYERFGLKGVDGERLLPRPELREYAQSLGISWGR